MGRGYNLVGIVLRTSENPRTVSSGSCLLQRRRSGIYYSSLTDKILPVLKSIGITISYFYKKLI